MHIELVPNNGYDYLRLVKSERYVRKDGKKSVRKNVVFNIGPLSKFSDGKPDYLKRLKESYVNGTPLINALSEYTDKKPARKKYNVDLSEGDPDCLGQTKLFSHCLIERILEELGLIAFFNRYKQLTDIEFDLLGFFRLLVYGRVLNPRSKIASVRQNDDYYDPIVKDPYEFNVYDTLSFIKRYENSIINKIHKHMVMNFGRTTKNIFYDVTNMFFEIEHADEDVVDENGHIIVKGQRKFGVSKENRKQPIVQMGMFIDEQGVPIGIKTFPGNTLDHQTVISALSETIDTLGLPRLIFVGDRGVYTGPNLIHLTKRTHGYVVSRSIDKTNAKEREWIFDQTDYKHDEDDIDKTTGQATFKYKSRILNRPIKLVDENNKFIESFKLTEKIVVYWSKNFNDRQVAENKSFLELVDKLVKNPDSFRITKAQTKGLKKFMKDEVVDKKTGEVIDSKRLLHMIDLEKINKFKEHMGYYQIVSSELEMPEREIIDIYHGLSKIEAQFRQLKGCLDARPIFVQNPDHVDAHLLVCMIALIVLRIIQNKIVKFRNKQDIKIRKDTKWEMGLSGDRIQAALNKWTVDHLTNCYYRMSNTHDKDLKLILDAFNIKIPVQLFGKMELQTLKTKIEITT